MVPSGELNVRIQSDGRRSNSRANLFIASGETTLSVRADYRLQHDVHNRWTDDYFPSDFGPVSCQYRSQ